MANEGGAVQFPVSWSPERLAALSKWQHETVWMGERGPIYPNIPPETVVKMRWQKSRYTVTYADGSRWCNIKDLELFYEEEDNE